MSVFQHCPLVPFSYCTPDTPKPVPHPARPVRASPSSPLWGLAGQLVTLLSHSPHPTLPQYAAASATLIIVNINHAPFTTVGRVIPPRRPRNHSILILPLQSPVNPPPLPHPYCPSSLGSGPRLLLPQFIEGTHGKPASRIWLGCHTKHYAD